MSRFLRVKDKHGVYRFASSDINECRDYLRSLGLEIGPRPYDGWRKGGSWPEPEWLGLIDYWNDKWNAAAWKRDKVVWNGHGYNVVPS